MTTAAAGAAGTDRFDAFEAAGWEEAAAAYEHFFGPITGRLIEPVLEAAGVAAGDRVLDLGCGPGALAASAAALGAHATGVDVAQAMVGRASAAHPGVDFRQADARRLPFAGASFDAAVANFAILHLSEPDRAVRELARVLGPDGRVVVTVWDEPVRARLFGWVLDALAAAGAESPADIPGGPPFFRFAADDELIALLDGNGFRGAEVRTIAFTHRASSIGEIWEGVVGGTVRTAALVRRQPLALQQAIREAFDEVVGHATAGAGGVDIPFSVKLGSATVSS